MTPQPAPLKDQLKALEHLQELDLKIEQIKKSKSSLPAALKAIDDSIAKLKITTGQKQAAIGENEKIQRQAGAALDLNKDRLARSSTRLEAVKNSQEFQAVQKELEQLRKMALSLEDQSKKAGDEIIAISKTLAELGAQLEKLEADRAEKAQSVSKEESQLGADISTLTSERSTHVAIVEVRILALYDRVRANRGGIGIVPAVAGRCKGCNMMVPPQLYNQIFRGTEMQACPSCHRILFVPAPSEGTGSGNPS